METVSILRRDAASTLEEHPIGPVEIDGRRYSPRIVVAGSRQRSFDTVGNRRTTHLLKSMLEMCESLLGQELRSPKAVQDDLQAIRTSLVARLSLFPFVQIASPGLRLPTRPAPEEMVDDRYRAVFDLYGELTRELGWSPGKSVTSRMAYVNYADQIYQAFVALVIARAFGARQVFPSLISGLPTALFRSEQHEIYYDTIPPSPAFTNWRDRSARPSEQRPDITIINTLERRGILADAKYRVDPSGRVPTSALEDAQVYLQSFGARSIAVCYPGPAPRIGRVSALGYTILEVSIGPYPELSEYARLEVRPALEEVMEGLRSSPIAAA